MAASLDLNDLACDALHALTEQVFNNLKLSTPALEELHKAATKYHAILEQANAAASAFVDSLGKVGVTACRARGATSELGLQFQKLVARHRGIIAERTTQTQKLEDLFAGPLARRLKSDSRVLPKMEDDFKSTSKAMRADLKKAGQTTFKAQQKARKAGEGESAVDSAVRSMSEKGQAFETFNQECLRAALIEERRRYCYLVDNYCAVFAPVDFVRPSDQELVSDVMALVKDPETLPDVSEALIQQTSSAFLHSGGTDPLVAPSPLTREYEALVRQRRGTASNDLYLPPGCPPGGLSDFKPSQDQINPRRPTMSGGPVPIDAVLAQQQRMARPPGSTR